MRNKSMQILNLIVSLIMLTTIIPFNAPAAQDNLLPNIAYKLGNNAPVTIGYLGGSLTAGSGTTEEKSWRAITSKWFKETYPNSAITEINASIGGFGSVANAFRVKQHLLKENPDLVFIEAAVNDWNANQVEVKRSLEGVIRQIYKHNPKTDIALVYTTTMDMATQSYAIGQEMKTVIWHQQIADHYGIPSIEAGRALYEKVTNGGVSWDEIYPTSDKTHPGDKGYAIYAKAVEDFLMQALSQPGGDKAHPLPVALTANNYENADIIDAWDETAVTSQGFALSGTPMGGRHPNMIESNTKDSVAQISFSGSTVGLYWLKASDGGMLEYWVDGQAPKTISACDAAAVAGSPRGTFNILYTDLSEGDHVLNIRVTGNNGTDSKGAWIRIGGFFVSGRAQQSKPNAEGADTAQGEQNLSEEQGQYDMFVPNYRYLFEKIGIPYAEETNKPITRGQAAIAVAAMLGITENFEAVPQFQDVPQSHPSFTAVSFLESIEVISPATHFNPDRIITINEVVKMLVLASGYYELTQIEQAYPFLYLQKARTLGILDEVDLGQTIVNMSVLEVLIYNTLTADASVRTVFGTTAVHEVKRGRTVMSVYHSIEYSEGIVNATAVSGLSGYSAVGKGRMLIGSDVLSTQQEMYPLLGYRVRYYYEDQQGGDRLLLYAEKKNNRVLEIISSDILDFDGMAYIYATPNGGSFKASVPLGVDLIYNGVKEQRTNMLMWPSNGFVEIIDNNNDGTYDVAKVFNFKDVVTARYAENKLYNLAIPGDSIDFDNTKYNITALSGAVVQPESLNKYDILSAAVSLGGDYVYGIVSRDYINGQAQEIETGERNRVKIGGVFYPVSESYGSFNQIKPGNQVTFYLNWNGEIAWCSQNTSADNSFALLITAAQVDGVEKRVDIKVVTVAGVVEVLAVSPRVIINGVKMPGITEILSTIHGYNGIIHYSKSEDGLITVLETAISSNATEGAALYTDNPDPSDLVYRGAVQSFGGKIQINADTMVFFVPQNGEDDDYYVGSSSLLTDRRTYSVTGFRTALNTLISNFIIIREGGSANRFMAASPVMLVTRRSMVQDKNGNDTISLSGLSNGREVSYVGIEPEILEPFKPGDVVRLLVNDKGFIALADYIYNAQTKTMGATVGSGFTSDPWVIKGKVYMLDDTCFRLHVGSDIDNATQSELYTIAFYSNRPIMKTRVKENKSSEVVEKYEIRDYKTYGSQADDVIVSLSGGLLNWVIILEQ